MRKFLALLFIALLIAGSMTACSGEAEESPGARHDSSYTGNNPPPQDLDETPAEDFEYRYVANHEGITIDRYTGSSLRVRIPEYIEGFPVTAIGENAFYESGIAYVYIPDTVTRIEDSSAYVLDGFIRFNGGAFAYTRGLTSITLPDNLVHLGSQAFVSSALTSLTLPDGLEHIGSAAFAHMSGLTGVLEIPNSVVFTGALLFYPGTSNLDGIMLRGELYSPGDFDSHMVLEP